MSRFLPAPLIGATNAVLVVVNTLFWAIPLLSLVLIKLPLANGPLRERIRLLAIGCGERWIACNDALVSAMTPTLWDVQGLEMLAPDGSYLVSANHQSWADIPVLQRVFRERIPFLMFFLKKELIWVPVLGLAWKGLDFPFMQRYSREFLRKHPELRGKDLETTRAMCEKLRGRPISIMNFLEGTRFRPAKHAEQQSPYRRLLKPKAGGVAFVMGALGEQLDCVLDVTVAYPGTQPSLWKYVSGRIPKIVVRVRRLEIPEELVGANYVTNESSRAFAQKWIGEQWRDKDEQLSRLLDDDDPPSG